MSDLRLGDRIRRVIRLTRTPSGELTPELVYERTPKRAKKRGSAVLKPTQRLVKRIAEAQQASAAKYLERHVKSNQKRRDGWLLELPVNVARAGRAGRKALKVNRLVLG